VRFLPPYAGVAALPDRRIRSAGYDATVYTAGMLLAQVLLFVAGLAQRRLLGPTAAGYWSLIGNCTVLFSLTSLGALDGASRQIPLHRGRGDLRTAGSASDTGASFSLLATVIAGSGLAALALVFGSHWNPELRYGLVLAGLIGPVQKLADAHEEIVQSTKRFSVSSLVALVEAAVTVVLQTAAVWALGYWGMFLGQLLIIAGAFCVWRRMGIAGVRRPAFRWRIEPPRLRELIRFGVPIMLNGQLWGLFLVVDNLIVAGFLSVRQLGYYALACSATTYIMVLPKSVAAALAPRMSERYGETGSASAVSRYSTGGQQLMAFMLLPVLVAGAFFFMPVLIRQALPAFAPAVAVVRIMVAGSFFVSLTSLPTKALLASGHRWSVTWLTFSSLVVNGTANLIAVVVLGGGLTGAALAVSISYAAAFLLLTTVAGARSGGGGLPMRHVVEIFAAFAYTAAAMWGVEVLLGGGGGALLSDVANATAKFALMVIALVPLLAIAQRRTGALGALQSLIRGGLRRTRRTIDARS